MNLDGSRESGYLTKTSLSILVALAVAFGFWSWLTDDSADALPVEIVLTASPVMMQEGFGVRQGCALPSGRYVIEVYRNDSSTGDRAASVQLRDGVKYGDSCRFTVKANVNPADRYGIRFHNMRDDFSLFEWVEHEDAVEEVDGDTRLVIGVAW